MPSDTKWRITVETLQREIDRLRRRDTRAREVITRLIADVQVGHDADCEVYKGLDCTCGVIDYAVVYIDSIREEKPAWTDNTT